MWEFDLLAADTAEALLAREIISLSLKLPSISIFITIISVLTKPGVIHLVRTHEGGRGVKQMRTNAYKGGGGLTHEVRTQSKKLSAFCIHPAIFPFAKDPSQSIN